MEPQRKRARTKNPQYALKDAEPNADCPTEAESPIAAEAPIVQSVFEHGASSKEATGNVEEDISLGEKTTEDEEEESTEEGGEEENQGSGSEDNTNDGHAVEENQDSGSEDFDFMDLFEDDIPLEPESMRFQHTHYTRQIKIQSRCFVKEAVEAINGILKPREKRWFHDHPQFKHFFHMHLEEKHKVMGMWMLLLHTVNLASTRQVWFIVNGVPIRYCIREHGLISGLYCHNYPDPHWKRLGNTDFVAEQFGSGTTITYADVKEKFLEMKGVKGISSGVRLRMAVLYFLCSVISGKTRRGEGAPSVDHFFLRACSDLELCQTFPWGRFSYDDNLTQMKNLFTNFGGVVESKGWCFPAFNIPLQVK